MFQRLAGFGFAVFSLISRRRGCRKTGNLRHSCSAWRLGRALSTTRTNWGMTSPARWTTTVSPTRTSSARDLSGSSLCIETF